MAHLTGWRRVARGVTLLALLLTLLAGCSLPWQQQSPPSDLVKDQTLRMAWNLAFAELDPAAPNMAAGLQVESLLFDTLVTAAPDGQVEPWGAQSWAISSDGLVYTFHIRPHQRFSDGTTVKPSDYARAIDRIANPCAQAAYGYLLAVLKDGAAFNAESCIDKHPDGALQTLVGDSIVADDSADTLTFTLARPAGYFLATLTHSTFSAIERSLIPTPTGGLYSAWTKRMSDGKTGQGGSGMFYLAAQSDTVLTLKPNPWWWGRHTGKTPHFTEVDITAGYSPREDFEAFSDSPALAFSDGVADAPHVSLAEARMQPYYHEQPLLAVTALQFDWRYPPFDDLNARKAFCLAINRDQINQQVYQGAMIPTWRIVPEGLPGYTTQPHGPDNTPVTGNASLARGYWRRYVAAHPKEPLPNFLTYASWFQADDQTIALLQKSWSSAGINVTLMNFTHVIPVQTSENALNSINFSRWWVDYLDPQDFLTILYARGALYNMNGAQVSVPAADALMRQADGLPDLSLRIPLYERAEQLLIDNVAVCPLFQTINRYALRPWVKGGFVEDARGVFPNDAWITGYIAKH